MKSWFLSRFISATTNTVQIGNKRRISDDDDNLTGSLSKRVRPHGELTAEFGEAEGDVDAEGESVSASTVSHRGSSPITEPEAPAKETADVREVRKGVREVDIKDNEENVTSEALPNDAKVKLVDLPMVTPESASKVEPTIESVIPEDESKDSLEADGKKDDVIEETTTKLNFGSEKKEPDQVSKEPLSSGGAATPISKGDITAAPTVETSGNEPNPAIDTKLTDTPITTKQAEDSSVSKED